MLDYYRSPELREAWGGPFNNQEGRKEIFRDIIRSFDFDAIVETGTYRGSTTEFLAAESKLSVYTVEFIARNYGFAKARFILNRSIHLQCGDSRVFLTKLVKNRKLKGASLFFYLDAHWEDDLPLLEEIMVISSGWKRAVIMVDDFKVPDDPGYGYDDYGEGKTLSLEYLAPLNASGRCYYLALSALGVGKDHRRLKGHVATWT